MMGSTLMTVCLSERVFNARELDLSYPVLSTLSLNIERSSGCVHSPGLLSEANTTENRGHHGAWPWRPIARRYWILNPTEHSLYYVERRR